MKIIVNIIPRNLVASLLLALFSHWVGNKCKNKTSWWFGNKIYFCFVFILSCALLQSSSNSIDFSKRILLHVISARIVVP